MNQHLRLFLGLSCGLGLFSLLDQYWLQLTHTPLLIGSYGATAVILYAAPHLEVARFKNVLWGHMLSCGIGLLLKLLLGNALPHMGPVLSIALSTTLMSILGVLHPPGGAISFIAYQAPLHSVTEALLFLLGAAIMGPLLFWGMAQWLRGKATTQKTFLCILLGLMASGRVASAQENTAWQNHLHRVKSLPLQAGCQPFSRIPQTQTPRGTVLLFHGYTACPQQYLELADLLAKEGYRVYVPLLPGHGRQYLNPHPRTFLSQGGDDISQMPGQYALETYTQFAEEMAPLLSEEPQERIVGGLSLGASLALYTAWKYPKAAQRAFVLSPLWDVAGINRWALPILAPALPYQRVSWGASCENERRLGRAGYCDFQLTHVSAVQKLGRTLQTHAQDIRIPVQMVGVEQDGAASNAAIAAMHERLPNNHSCWLPVGASHSMLSPQDNPTRHMFWLPALKAQLIRFVRTGQAFDTHALSEHGIPQCRSHQ